MHHEPNPELRRLARQVRWLSRYAAASSILLLLLVTGAFRPSRERIPELDVERLNVRRPDGRLAVVIAGDERSPGNLVGGRERRTGGRGNGLIFYDTEGNEAGGLVFHAKMNGGVDSTLDAGGQLSLDRFESDQVVAMRYLEDPAQGMIAGLQVSYFTKHGVAEWLAGQDSIDRLPEAARDTARRSLRRHFMQTGRFEVPRVFVGERGRTASIQMRDTRGRERIRLVVDSLDVARLEILDTAGKVQRRIPE
jgi:hypothetical protein